MHFQNSERWREKGRHIGYSAGGAVGHGHHRSLFGGSLSCTGPGWHQAWEEEGDLSIFIFVYFNLPGLLKTNGISELLKAQGFLMELLAPATLKPKAHWLSRRVIHALRIQVNTEAMVNSWQVTVPNVIFTIAFRA